MNQSIQDILAMNNDLIAETDALLAENDALLAENETRLAEPAELETRREQTTRTEASDVSKLMRWLHKQRFRLLFVLAALILMYLSISGHFEPVAETTVKTIAGLARQVKPVVETTVKTFAGLARQVKLAVETTVEMIAGLVWYYTKLSLYDPHYTCEPIQFPNAITLLPREEFDLEHVHIFATKPELEDGVKFLYNNCQDKTGLSSFDTACARFDNITRVSDTEVSFTILSSVDSDADSFELQRCTLTSLPPLSFDGLKKFIRDEKTSWMVWIRGQLNSYIRGLKNAFVFVGNNLLGLDAGYYRQLPSPDELLLIDFKSD